MTTAASVAALNLFIPITKIDAANRLVYGIATAEKVDRSGEVCDYETTKPFYEKWSGDIAKASGGKSLGNLRAMHGKVAAGKVTTINFNDEAKQIEVCSKVVDDNEWKKVEEGVYTGFSQGGAYVKRWKDGDVQKYTANPSEISLVDLPCLPEATFEVIKADGATELRKFVTVQQPAVTEPTNDQIVAKAGELAKAAGKDGFADFITQARAELMKAVSAPEKPAEESAPGVTTEQGQVEKTTQQPAPAAQAGDEYEQVWLSKRDGQTFKTKAELRKHHDTLDAAAAAAKTVSPVQTALADLSATLGIEKAAADAKTGKTDDTTDAKANADDQGNDPVTGKKKKKAKKFETAEDLRKGLYDIGRLANLIAELNWFAADATWERSAEGDDSTLPEQLKSSVASLCQALRDMVVEETSELFDPENENDALLITVLEMAAGVPADAMNALVKFAQGDEGLAKCRDAVEKAGARHSKKDQEHIQAAHDHSVMAGADCGAEKMAKQADELSKAVARGDALQKTVDDLLPQIAEIQKAVKHLLDQPAPHPATRVVSKGEDNGGPAEGAPLTADQLLAKFTPDQLATAAIRAAQQNGQPLLSRGK